MKSRDSFFRWLASSLPVPGVEASSAVVAPVAMVRALCLCVVVLAACGCGGGSGETPNSVFVLLVDTVRRDALGCYGNEDRPTPNLDALAADGVRFEHAISSSGWTLPSVASLLTGTWPTLHGARGKGVQLTPIREEIATFTEVFQDAGYATSAVANAAFVSPMLGIDRGFDEFDHKHSYNWDARRAQETIDIALEMVRDNRDDPQFALVHLFDAHLMYDPPPAYATKYTDGRMDPPPPLTMDLCLGMQKSKTEPPARDDIQYVKDVYHAEVAYLDEHVGRFVAELRTLGLYDAATIIVVADHGEEFWEHGGFEHGHTLHDELVRVPLIVKFPKDQGFAGRVVDAQVRMIDILPTALELRELDAPATSRGRSMLPLVREEPDEPRPAFCESTLYGAEQIAWRSDRYTYIYDQASGGKLYDWRADPGETRDLAKSDPATAARLREELHGFWSELREEAGKLATSKAVDLSPDRIEQLRALGYIRDDE